MASQAIRLTESDFGKVAGLLAEERRWPVIDRAHSRALADRIGRAMVLPDHEIPADVITLQSRARVADLDTGRDAIYLLVMPAQASSAAGTISVSSPKGAALLGCREGDETECRVPGGLRRMRIERVLFQPQAAAHRSSRPAAGDASAPDRQRRITGSSSLASRVA